MPHLSQTRWQQGGAAGGGGAGVGIPIIRQQFATVTHKKMSSTWWGGIDFLLVGCISAANGNCNCNFATATLQLQLCNGCKCLGRNKTIELDESRGSSMCCMLHVLWMEQSGLFEGGLAGGQTDEAGSRRRRRRRRRSTIVCVSG